ncbi:hypothetical protein Cni_G03848 [Canna indica]|uniref:Uncharacterized protein n=1 Tax=Canna indica TaxID=4628 RepID=A0AAQ3JUT5_9LILI|nr:hypothetical protein Cni_G03848 [Canna indica]
MITMDSRNLEETIDLERGIYSAKSDKKRDGLVKGLLRKSSRSSEKQMMSKETMNLEDNFSISLLDHDEKGDVLTEKFKREEMESNGIRVSAQEPRKKATEKHPKPPRHPNSLTMCSSDRNLIQEISELVMLKRGRIQHMKAVKKLKNVKAGSICNANSVAMVVTILFFLIIIRQAF